jgi:hypothetical protein
LHERRKSIRLKKAELPEVLREFIIKIGTNDEVRAETVDASTSGMGLSINLTKNRIEPKDPIIIHSLDNRFEFTGEIVYKNKKTDKYILGVKFI